MVASPIPSKLLNGPRSRPPNPANAGSSPGRSATVISAEGIVEWLPLRHNHSDSISNEVRLAVHHIRAEIGAFSVMWELLPNWGGTAGVDDPTLVPDRDERFFVFTARAQEQPRGGYDRKANTHRRSTDRKTPSRTLRGKSGQPRAPFRVRRLARTG